MYTVCHNLSSAQSARWKGRDYSVKQCKHSRVYRHWSFRVRLIRLWHKPHLPPPTPPLLLAAASNQTRRTADNAHRVAINNKVPSPTLATFFCTIPAHPRDIIPHGTELIQRNHPPPSPPPRRNTRPDKLHTPWLSQFCVLPLERDFHGPIILSPTPQRVSFSPPRCPTSQPSRDRNVIPSSLPPSLLINFLPKPRREQRHIAP